MFDHCQTKTSNHNQISHLLYLIPAPRQNPEKVLSAELVEYPILKEE